MSKNLRDKVYNLYKRYAGDKFPKVDATAEKMIAEGYKPERAWADALEKHKCVKHVNEEVN